ncbi:MAG TPA: ATP-binding protein, partial [Candidatus Dormibacteraeota bacterium]|nr:ATP-binding protein [Candidatus Dormibacteraeota bacterium]
MPWDEWDGRPWGRGEAPPWWPRGEPWPPTDPGRWRRPGRRMARRIGCFVLLVTAVLGGIGTALVWLVLSAAGVVGAPPIARIGSAAALTLGIAAAIMAVRFLRRMAAPAGDLVEGARRVERGDYSARVPVRGPGELRSLARAFNAMSGRLEADEMRRRSVLADVAHELRTPLTIIRGQAEAVAEGVYPAEPEQMAPILAAAATLEALVDDLRTVALADAGNLRLRVERLEIGDVVEHALEGLRPAAATAGVRLRAEVAPDTPALDGDGARLTRVVANLVSNALRYTAAGGTVEVAVRPVDGGIRVTVRDDGEGVPPDLLPRIFDRFVKGPKSDGS